MFKKLLQRRGPQPVDLPLGYHWEKYIGSGPCVCCGQPRPNELGTIVAWRRLGACLRNNVLNDNRLDQGYYYDIPHIKAYYPRNRSKHDAISL